MNTTPTPAEPATEPATDVVFRVLNGHVIALMPGVAGTMDVNTCSSYMHTGQHGAADVDLGRHARLATPAEYEPLKRELEAKPFGYTLRVVSRCTSKHRRMRLEQLR